MSMKIVFAAKDGFDYNRVKVLREGLALIPDCEVELFKIPMRNKAAGEILKSLSADAQAVYVPPFRHRDLAFVRKYSSAPVVFDPLISRYLTKVIDYKHYHKAPQKWFIDFRDFRNCDLLISDTPAHLNYFKKTFFLPKRQKTLVLPVGVNTDLFQTTNSTPKNTQTFKIGFYGSFVPLQGTLKIIEMAAHLQKQASSIQLEIIGSGYQYQRAQDMVKRLGLNNLHFRGWLKYEELAEAISNFDLCLGIFGESLKADLVVPNKIYHYAAMGKAILSKENETMRAFFNHNENIFLSSTDPSEMAEVIINLSKQPDLLLKVGENARKLMLERYSHKKLAEQFIDAIKEL